MKILIITYSREVNPGTFLQAYGVQYAFRRLYPDAQIDLIKHKRMYSIAAEKEGASRSKFSFVKAKVRAIPRRLKYEWAYRTKFHLTEKEFDFFDYDDDEFKEFAEKYDLIIVGSDTILINLEKQGHYGLMWLTNVNTNKILFAASAAPVNFELNDAQRECLYKSFGTFKLLGVRDRVTEHFLRDKIGLGDRVYIQYDPTYLIPESKFSLPSSIKKKLERIRKRQKVALVNFALTGCPFKKEITDFLKQQGYYIVSTLYNESADCNLMSLSPFEWAAVFKYIDLTVTERFHDTVFTLRNDKPVIAIDWNRSRFSRDGFSKTQNLLSQYGLECNHFIATNLKEARVVMDYIEKMDVDREIVMIHKHNQHIQAQYGRLLEQIKRISIEDFHYIFEHDRKSELVSNELQINELGGGKRCLKNRLRGVRLVQWGLKIRNSINDRVLARKRRPYLRRLERLIPRDTSIISSNCFAGRVMQDIGMQYNTPTLGLFIMGPDMNEFLLHLKHYLTESKIEFQSHSKWACMDEHRARWKHWYPIGWLDGGKVEIHFLHYHTEEEAAEKWYRRAARVNFDRLMVIVSQQNLSTREDVEAFDRLPIANKYIFSADDVPGKSVIYMPEFAGQGKVGDPYRKGHLFYRHLVEKLEQEKEEA